VAASANDGTLTIVDSVVSHNTADSSHGGGQALVSRGARAVGPLVQALLHEETLDQDRLMLAQTVITSPVDGIVIARNVDVGQTVVASMQAQTLFVIAADLSKVELDTNIDESDMGRIREGQPVTFRARLSAAAGVPPPTGVVDFELDTSGNVIPGGSNFPLNGGGQASLKYAWLSAIALGIAGGMRLYTLIFLFPGRVFSINDHDILQI
jgi:multidrug efflux pump subunit AcrA (membrane-fusion protein)